MKRIGNQIAKFQLYDQSCLYTFQIHTVQTLIHGIFVVGDRLYDIEQYANTFQTTHLQIQQLLLAGY